MDREIRKFQKKTPRGWRNCKLSSIKKGNIFRVYDPGNIPVTWKGVSEFKASKDASMCEDHQCYHVVIE